MDRPLLRWSMLGLVLAAQTVISAVTQGVPTLAPWIRADLHLSLAQVALFATVINLATMATVAFSGWAVDTLGEKVVQVVGTLVVGLAAGAFAASPGGAVAFVPLAVAGVGASAPTPSGSRTIMRWFERAQRGLAMGLRQTGIPLGGAVAAAAAPVLASAFGWRGALMAGAAACVAVAGLSAFVYREPSDVAVPVASHRPSSGGRGIRGLITRDIALLGVSGGLLPFAQFSMVTYLAIFLAQVHHIPIALGASLLLAAQISGVVGRVLWGVASDRLFGRQRRPPLMAAALLAMLGAAALAWLPPGAPFWAVTGVILVMGFNAIGWQGNWVALAAELAGTEQQGRVLGLCMTLTYLGIAIGPPIVGTIVDHTGSWTLAWATLSVALGAGLLCVVPVREGARSMAARPAVRRA